MFNFFRDHDVLTSLQSGYIPGESTVNQLVHIYNTFCKALDVVKEVCDISKALGLGIKVFYTNSKQLE